MADMSDGDALRWYAARKLTLEEGAQISRSLDAAAAMMRPDERAASLSPAGWAGRQGLLVVTDQRVVFLDEGAGGTVALDGSKARVRGARAVPLSATSADLQVLLDDGSQHTFTGCGTPDRARDLAHALGGDPTAGPDGPTGPTPGAGPAPLDGPTAAFGPPPGGGFGGPGSAGGPGGPAGPPPGYGWSGYSATPGGYGYVQGPPFAKPSTNLVGAILATLFCCLPLGIVAIVFAAQVDSKWAAGDWYGAQESSKKARMWANISLAAGILGGLAYFALVVAAGGTSSGGYRGY